ncbi:hypothetical protein AAFF_G00268470 [Aldrovandia affinis]|uniref:Uncharacterized protein n=1 Tax=Aldrovandia affinis TaxID=143900 RepID=A0AAD7WSW6_9TELE|nr:hypothetical protein AAFF_G00268470 [Aldrovandia affinis]
MLLSKLLMRLCFGLRCRPLCRRPPWPRLRPQCALFITGQAELSGAERTYRKPSSVMKRGESDVMPFWHTVLGIALALTTAPSTDFLSPCIPWPRGSGRKCSWRNRGFGGLHQSCVRRPNTPAPISEPLPLRRRFLPCPSIII